MISPQPFSTSSAIDYNKEYVNPLGRPTKLSADGAKPLSFSIRDAPRHLLAVSGVLASRRSASLWSSR